jgi:hypothetical protein
MVVRIFLAVLGLFHLANAVWMLGFAGSWAAVIAHDTAPTPLEFHFITDIGMIFLASAAGLLWSARQGKAFAPWALAGAVWPALHALFHLQGWILDGAPHALRGYMITGGGVILTGLLGLLLAWLRLREGDA